MSFQRDFEIVGDDFANAGRVSTEIKAILRGIGFPGDVVRRLVIAVYEAEMNVVMYADRGILTLMLSPQRLEVVVKDEGPGIPDIELAMKEGYSTATEEMRQLGFGAGMGLPNIRKNADAMSIDSQVGSGTRLHFLVNVQRPAGRQE